MKNITYKTIIAFLLFSAVVPVASANRRPKPGAPGGPPPIVKPGIQTGTTVTTAAKPGSTL
jgi:hypothetical protein